MTKSYSLSLQEEYSTMSELRSKSYIALSYLSACLTSNRSHKNVHNLRKSKQNMKKDYNSFKQKETH